MKSIIKLPFPTPHSRVDKWEALRHIQGVE